MVRRFFEQICFARFSPIKGIFMKTRLFFARAMTLALVAGGIVASLSTEAMAINRTWTNASTSASGNGKKWGTTTQFATNWSGNTNPLAADTAVFTGTNGATQEIAIQSANVPIGKLTFSGSTAYKFTGNALSLRGDSSIPNVAIANASGKAQTFTAVQIGSPTVHANSTGAGSLVLTAVDLQGNYLAVGGDAAVTGLTGTGSSTYEAKSGTQVLTFATGNAVGTLKVNGATVTSAGDTNGTFLDIQGGVKVGGGTFLNTSITSGQLNLADQTFSSLNLTGTTGATYVQGAGGFTKMDVGYDGAETTFSLVSTQPGSGFTLGGSLLLDGTTMGSSPLANGLVWNLFQGVNFTAGSASAPNDASNFSALVLADGGSGSPYAGAFTQFGQEWISPSATDGTYLVFQAATGNLVVVPEPSTIVFAGLGVAMSGWTMWKKRRLSKLLAAKAG